MDFLKRLRLVLAILWRLPELNNDLEDVDNRVADLEEVLPDIAKLGTAAAGQMLTQSELSLAKAAEEADVDVTMDQLDEMINEQLGIKQALNLTPAVGSRDVVNRNRQIVETNKTLSGLYVRRTRLRREANGTDTVN